MSGNTRGCARLPDSRHKARNPGQIFAANRETKKPRGEIAVKQKRAKLVNKQRAPGHRSGAQAKTNVRTENGTMLARHWLDYDSVALAVLIIGLALVEFLALSM